MIKSRKGEHSFSTFSTFLSASFSVCTSSEERGQGWRRSDLPLQQVQSQENAWNDEGKGEGELVSSRLPI